MTYDEAKALALAQVSTIKCSNCTGPIVLPRSTKGHVSPIRCPRFCGMFVFYPDDSPAPGWQFWLGYEFPEYNDVDQDRMGEWLLQAGLVV